MPRCIEKTLKGTRCKANGLEHEGKVRCNTHRHIHIIANAVEVPDFVEEPHFAPTPELYNHNRYMLPTIIDDQKDQRINELEEQLANLMAEKKKDDYDAIAEKLADHLWHLDENDDLVYDWLYEVYEAKGWTGLYNSIKGANKACKVNGCSECASILGNISWRCT